MTVTQEARGTTSYRTVRRHLFGGAITAELPQSFIDASEIRQVPDNQEVLISSSSDASIIVEVLESVTEGAAGSDMVAATRFHFDSLAHDNSAASSTIDTLQVVDTSTLPIPPPLTDAPASSQPRHSTPSPWTLSGVQQVPKFGRAHEPPHQVRIHMAVWRLLPIKNVDLVMTFNVPIAANSTEDTSAREQLMLAELFSKAVATLTIEDWDLFQ